MAGPNKAKMKVKLRSALAHKSVADSLLAAIVKSQEQLNAALAKLDADAPGTLDVNYSSLLSISPVFESDEPKLPGQHKATLRKALRSALAHRKLADEICDSIEEFHVGLNALLSKLDAEAGVLSDVNYSSLLALSVVDAEAAGLDAQHKASLRKSLRSALADAHLADQLMDALVGAQESFNAALVLLDAGTITGVMAPLEVSVLDPESRS